MKRKKGKSYQQNHTEFFLQLKEAPGKAKHWSLVFFLMLFPQKSVFCGHWLSLTFMSHLQGKLFHKQVFMERFSNDCRKTNTTVTTRLITTGDNCAINQSEFLVIIPSAKRKKNCAYKPRLVWLLIGWKTDARFLNQSISVAITISNYFR